MDSNQLTSHLVAKLEAAAVDEHPFRHVIIEDFLPDECVEKLLDVARVPGVRTSLQLWRALRSEWAVQPFPGCSPSWSRYFLERGIGLPWRDERVSGRGLALRYSGDSSVVKSVRDAMTSDEFTACVKQVMGLRRPVRADSGLQKYLDGYEIAPHSDPHAKAATILVNLGIDGVQRPGTGTRLLQLKDERRYVQTFWRYNKNIDPDWVPWSWCEEVREVDMVNSLLIFCPDETTIHAVKCAYDHNAGQRLQLYGDYWFTDVPSAQPRASYRALDVRPDASIRERLAVYRHNRRMNGG